MNEDNAMWRILEAEDGTFAADLARVLLARLNIARREGDAALVPALKALILETAIVIHQEEEAQLPVDGGESVPQAQEPEPESAEPDEKLGIFQRALAQVRAMVKENTRLGRK